MHGLALPRKLRRPHRAASCFLLLSGRLAAAFRRADPAGVTALPPCLFLILPTGGPREKGCSSIVMCRTQPSSFGPAYPSHCISRRCSHTMLLSLFGRAVPICKSVSVPTGGADGHNSRELTSLSRKDGAERALRL